MRLVRIDGRWVVQGRTKGKVWRRSLGTKDRQEAERLFRDYRKPVSGELIGDVMQLYLDDKEGKRSHGSMLTAWRSLRPTFGHLRPDQIDRGLCRSYAELRRAGGVADGTIIKDLGVLKASLNWAKKPGAVFEFPPAPPPRDRAITRAEVQRMVDACELGHVKLFIILAWCTAGRHSALLELKWSQVDFERRNIRLATDAARGRKGRATPYINDWLLGALRTAYEARTSDYVIEWGGQPLKSIKRSFGEAASKAGIADVTPHVLRHSAAVAMVGAGISMEKVAQFLGHTTMRVTERVYGRFRPDHLKDAAKALE